MRDAMARAIKNALGCTVYQETVPQGLGEGNCVILERTHTLHAQTPLGIPVTARYTVIARGCAVELVCKALSCVTDRDGNRFRAVRLNMKMHEDRAEVLVEYRGYLQGRAEEAAPMMECISLNERKKL